MNKLVKFTMVLLVALLAVMLLPATVAAQECTFYGTVKVDGANVPDGTSITAWMGGVQVADTTTYMEGADSYYFLDVPGEYENDGDPVSFMIGALVADQVGYWFPFDAQLTNLTAGGGPTTGTLEGKVHLQGRPDPPSDTWITDLTVSFLQDTTVVRTDNVTTDNEGNFLISNIAVDTYDIGVKGSHTLSRLEEDVVIGSGTNNVDFGTLLEGDCYENDVINTYDFGVLADAFYSVENGPPWDERADLNNDGVVNIYDFGLLADNYGQSGEMPS